MDSGFPTGQRINNLKEKYFRFQLSKFRKVKSLPKRFLRMEIQSLMKATVFSQQQ